ALPSSPGHIIPEALPLAAPSPPSGAGGAHHETASTDRTRPDRPCGLSELAGAGGHPPPARAGAETDPDLRRAAAACAATGRRRPRPRFPQPVGGRRGRGAVAATDRPPAAAGPGGAGEEARAGEAVDGAGRRGEEAGDGGPRDRAAERGGPREETEGD